MYPCPKCNGQVLKKYDDESCLQCGWRPIPDTLPLTEERERRFQKISNAHKRG